VPELPEVEALATFLRERAVGRFIRAIDVASISVLKTFDPPPTALHGLAIDDVQRVGKFLDIDVSGLHLVAHLSRAGWVRWSDALNPKPLRPGKGPISLRVRLDDGSGFDFTEAGTQKRLAIWIVQDRESIQQVSRLGPDPLAEDFTEEQFAAILKVHGRAQIKGVLRDQSLIAGIGNAYSDEILHAAKLSPYHPAGTMSDDEVHLLYEQLRALLAEAVKRSAGLPAGDLKDDKRAGMRVHGRSGLTCPVCGDVVREVSFADRSMQYCATCQTGGKILADRRMSRLLK
jgi:formamidopyrimidine-DNA glycosylase